MVLGFGISVSALSRRRQTGSWLLIPNDDCGPVLGNWLLWLLTLHVSRIKWDGSKQQTYLKNSIHPHLYEQRLLLFKVYTNICLLEWWVIVEHKYNGGVLVRSRVIWSRGSSFYLSNKRPWLCEFIKGRKDIHQNIQAMMRSIRLVYTKLPARKKQDTIQWIKEWNHANDNTQITK